MLEPLVAERVRELCSQPIIADVLDRLQRELSPVYCYHSIVHTKDVLEEAVRFALHDGLDDRSIELIAVAAAYHEVGFLIRPCNNEPLAAEMSVEATRAAHDYTVEEQQLIHQMILDTEVQDFSKGPAQVANTELSKYLLDGDLANLGREDFFEKMELIRKELETEEIEIAKRTLKLCKAHSWQTPAAKQLLEAVKQQNMKLLEEKLAKLTK